MNDVEKTKIQRQDSYKRTKRRKRSRNVYALVVVLLVIAVGVAVCFTFLFNVDEIVISGESETYTYMDVIEKSGIRVGDNLFRMDTQENENMILDQLVYVETAEVTKDFPKSVHIHVTRCIPAFNFEYGDSTILVSRKGKILSVGESFNENLPVVYGFEVKDPQEGEVIESENEHKTEAFMQMTEALDSIDADDFSEINMDSEYDIAIAYKGGIVFRLGGWTDVQYKLRLAESVMNDSSVKGRKGYLTMIGSNQCSFRIDTDATAFPQETTTVPAENTTQVTTTTTAVTTETTAVPEENYDYYNYNNYNYNNYNNYNNNYNYDYNYGYDYGYYN